MAHHIISLTNGVEIKNAPIGFSWTTFFFGGIPAAIRGDWLWAIGIFVGSFLTWGIVAVIAAFIYNRIYVKSLFDKGYKIHTLPYGYSENELKIDLGYLKFPYEV